MKFFDPLKKYGGISASTMMAIFSGTQRLIDILRYFFTWLKPIQKENSFFDRWEILIILIAINYLIFCALISPKSSTHLKKKLKLYIYISAYIHVNFPLIYL